MATVTQRTVRRRKCDTVMTVCRTYVVRTTTALICDVDGDKWIQLVSGHNAEFTPDTCLISCIHLCPLVSLVTVYTYPYRRQNCRHGYMYHLYPQVEHFLDLELVSGYTHMV